MIWKAPKLYPTTREANCGKKAKAVTVTRWEDTSYSTLSSGSTSWNCPPLIMPSASTPRKRWMPTSQRINVNKMERDNRGCKSSLTIWWQLTSETHGWVRVVEDGCTSCLFSQWVWCHYSCQASRRHFIWQNFITCKCTNSTVYLSCIISIIIEYITIPHFWDHSIQDSI